MSFERVRERLAGVVAITVTPFDSHDKVDVEALATITRRMVDAGIPTVTPNGNTSEYYSLTEGERSTCLRVVAAEARDALVLAGVGGALPDALRAARDAREAGAEAVMVHHPVHPYITASGWVAYHEAIAHAVPELAVVPYIKSLNVTSAAIVQLAESTPGFVGLKYALPDPVVFASARADTAAHDLIWIAGLAESYAPSQFAASATGFTSGLANVVPEQSLSFFHSLRAGDFAGTNAQWRAIRAFEDLRARDNNALNVSVVKEALHQLGLCDRAVRPPISVLDSVDRDLVSQMLEEWARTPTSISATN